MPSPPGTPVSMGLEQHNAGLSTLLPEPSGGKGMGGRVRVSLEGPFRLVPWARDLSLAFLRFWRDITFLQAVFQLWP